MKAKKMMQGMVEFQASGAESLTVKFNNWYNDHSKDYKHFRVSSFDVKIGRNPSNEVIETLYILFEYEWLQEGTFNPGNYPGGVHGINSIDGMDDTIDMRRGRYIYQIVKVSREGTGFPDPYFLLPGYALQKVFKNEENGTLSERKKAVVSDLMMLVQW